MELNLFTISGAYAVGLTFVGVAMTASHFSELTERARRARDRYRQRRQRRADRVPEDRC